MKKLAVLLLVAAMVLALCACGGSGDTAAAGDTAQSADSSADSSTGQTYEFTFGTVDTEEHPSTMSAHKLGEILEEKAPGKFKINVYPNSTLGGAAELVESVQMGNVDMACPATSFVANYVPSLWAFLTCPTCSPLLKRLMPFWTRNRPAAHGRC
ncbi:MAG: hypothetical protein V8T45_00330 [Oscillospiraceae bacterium]